MTISIERSDRLRPDLRTCVLTGVLKYESVEFWGSFAGTYRHTGRHNSALGCAAWRINADDDAGEIGTIRHSISVNRCGLPQRPWPLLHIFGKDLLPISQLA